MSRISDDSAEDDPAKYLPLLYDDPRFYDLRQEDPAAPESTFLPSLPENGYQQSESGLMHEYRGPDDLAVEGVESRDETENASVGETSTGGSQPKKRLVGLGGVMATLSAVFLKFKVLLDIKWVAYLSKFGLASISALISVAIYSRLFGWSFAIGLVVLLFVHEMGHAAVMKLKGIPVRGLVFIPMLGAAVFMRQMPVSARDEAEVGIAGPLAGALASLACLVIAHTQLDTAGSPGIWAPLAFFGCFLNLFNLIPIVPFDGGRVLAAIDRRIWIFGLLVLVAIQVWEWLTGNTSVWLLLFIAVAATDFWTRRSIGKSSAGQAYYAVPLSERITIGLIYFALAVALVMGMTLAHDMLFF